ncbi:MAG: glycosyltransferase family 39 protein [bacterium]|nr:glycosyltransferase family 39 protein [bacterium]
MRINKILFIILLVGLMVRLFLFFYFLDTPRFFWDDDSSSYINNAENILLGNGFSRVDEPPYEPDAFRTPGYPTLLLLHKVVLGSYYAVLITQSLLVILIALMIFLLARDYGNTRTGYWTAFIFLAMPFSIQVSLKFLTQSFFAFALMLSVWFWLKFLKNGYNKHLILTALILPLLALIRPIAQFIYLPFFISFIYSAWIYGRITLKSVLKTGLILGIIFFVGILPWLYRNYTTFGYFSLSSIIPSQMYFYDAPAVYAYNHGISNREAADILSKEAEEHFGAEQGEFSALFSSGKYLKEQALGIMFEHPSSLLIVRGVQFFKFFIRDGIHYWFDTPLPSPKISLDFIKSITPMLVLVMLERFILLILFLGMITTAISSFWCVDKYKKSMIGLLILIIFYFAALSGIMSSAGLRYPVEAIFILTGFIGLGIVRGKLFSLKHV